MGAGEEILARLAAMEAKLDKLAAHLGANGSASNGGAAGGKVATTEQIKGDHGDPEIGRMPKNWNGDNFEGLRASQCSPEFLGFYADFLDWKAANPRAGKEKYAKYDSLNAARCRRWAVEIREGRHKQSARSEQTAAPPPGDDYDHGAAVWDRGGPPGRMPPPPDEGGYGDDDAPF